MSCVAYLPNGSVDCKVPMAPVKGVIITTKSFSFGGLTAIHSYATWKAAVDTTLTMYPLRGLTSYEVTTEDSATTTTQKGQTYEGTRPAPKGLFYVDSNLCDYTELLRTLKGGQYGIVYYLEDGNFLVKRNKYTGNFSPFPARLYAGGKGIPLPSDIGNNFPVRIYHLDADDFEDAALVDPQFDYEDLIAATPAGLNMWVTTPWASTKVVVMITDRAGTGRAGLIATDFVIISSNFLTTPAVASIVDNTGGSYDLVITKATSTALSAGDHVVVQARDSASTGAGPFAYISNKLRIQA